MSEAELLPVSTPREAWERLVAGNTRFLEDRPEHPSQSAARRTEVSQAQHPFAVVFGCSDSRLAAEIIFDQGLGDVFVVRTAGQVIDTTVIGSIEYGVEVLGTPLVVVLGHDSCGALGAAVDALTSGTMPQGFVRAIVDRVLPSIIAPGSVEPSADGGADLHIPPPHQLLREHVRSTVRTLTAYSQTLASAVAEGRLAVVGLEYALADGRATLVSVAGDIGEEPAV